MAGISPKTVVKKKKPTKGRKTSPSKKNEKNGRQQPVKRGPAKKSTAIESETEGYVAADEFDDTEYPTLDGILDDINYCNIGYPDKEY